MIMMNIKKQYIWSFSEFSIFCKKKFKMENLVIQGKYQHYKGGLYKVIHEAVNNETDEVMIIYREVGKRKVYYRPKDEFLMNVMFKGEVVPRFKYLEDKVKE